MLRFDKDCDRRRYNLPGAASREIAVIIPGDGEQSREPRDIILRLRGGGLRRINEMSPAYHALHFVLLFPSGQLGWHPEIPFADGHAGVVEIAGGDEAGRDVGVHGKCKFVSQVEHSTYRLHIRPNESDHLFRAGRLLQEYIVDRWAAAEQSRLRFLQNNQKTLRAEVYRGLADAVAADPDVDGQNLGRRTILPSSFTGSTRFIIQNLQDALAINLHFGGANLFLTMTADPNWPEIRAELLPGQTPADRPDLVTCVFRAKMAKLHDDLHTHGVIGKTVARVWVIEFQPYALMERSSSAQHHLALLWSCFLVDAPLTSGSKSQSISTKDPHVESSRT